MYSLASPLIQGVFKHAETHERRSALRRWLEVVECTIELGLSNALNELMGIRSNLSGKRGSLRGATRLKLALTRFSSAKWCLDLGGFHWTVSSGPLVVSILEALRVSAPRTREHGPAL